MITDENTFYSVVRLAKFQKDHWDNLHIKLLGNSPKGERDLMIRQPTHVSSQKIPNCP